jgi:nitric oxide reductase NorQ protein
MPPTRSAANLAVIDALDRLAATADPARTLTIDSIRDTLRDAHGITDFGAEANYLRRGIRSLVDSGRVRAIGSGAFRFVGSAPAVAPVAHDAESPASFSQVAASGESEPHATDALVTPAIDRTFRMAPAMRDYFGQIAAAAQGGSIEGLRFIGPAGCGKTEAALQIAAMAGFDAFVIDCSIVREPRDWFGSRTVKNGAIAWQDSQFVRAVTRGNTVIILDEANRASLTVGNALLPLLDRRRATLVEERGSVVRVAPGTVFVATMNEGAAYTGTGPMDAALRDRFPRVIEMTYLRPDEEAALLVARTGIDAPTAARLVEIAGKTRTTTAGVATFSTVLSTRQLLAAAADFRLAGPPSLAYTVANLYPAEGGNESERAQVTALLVGKFGPLT